MIIDATGHATHLPRGARHAVHLPEAPSHAVRQAPGHAICLSEAPSHAVHLPEALSHAVPYGSGHASLHALQFVEIHVSTSSWSRACATNHSTKKAKVRPPVPLEKASCCYP